MLDIMLLMMMLMMLVMTMYRGQKWTQNLDMSFCPALYGGALGLRVLVIHR